MIMRLPLSLLGLLTAALLFGQNDDIRRLPPERMQEIKAQKVAFITQRLALTPEEAQVFWPIYNRYEAELEAVRDNIGKGRREAHDFDKVTEEQAERLLTAEMENERRELEIRQKYTLQLKEAVGARKALNLGRTERDFTRELFRRHRPDGPGGPGGPGGPPPPRKGH